MVERRDTLLLVEDDVHIRMTMSAILRDEGYQIVEAANGQEALDQLHAGLRPCMILLDIRMPIMSGWEFRGAQSRDAQLAMVPVVVISADRDTREHAMQLGIPDFLTKPIDLDRLLAIVRQNCAGERAVLN